MNENQTILREEMDARNYHNDIWRAGLAAIVGGESDFIPKWETGYSHTSNARIRMIFGHRVGGMSDDELNDVKRTDQSWFNFIYGPDNDVGRGLGNTEPNDGYLYRGGGMIQITGKNNFNIFGPLVGLDLITHPELVVIPRVAAAIAVEYMKLNFHGGSFNAMKAAVGNSVGEPDARKNELFAEFQRTHEWDFRGIAPAATPKVKGAVAPVIATFLVQLQAAEKFLRDEAKTYTGPLDYDPGPGFRAALQAYLKTTGN